MANLKALSFVAFLVAAFIVVHSENACQLLISRNGNFKTSLRGGNERFVCKLAPECPRADHRVLGPFWKFNDKWIPSSRSYLNNATNMLTIVKISGDDFGTYECLVKINGHTFRAAVKLVEHLTT